MGENLAHDQTVGEQREQLARAAAMRTGVIWTGEWPEDPGNEELLVYRALPGAARFALLSWRSPATGCQE